ncbi:MAG: hypothetical protein C5S44_04275 [Candidatus Methanocomedens sp.]|nr:MAG: hypothetical protein C5S44_04275 [ANME-2 cluster archaeon]
MNKLNDGDMLSIKIRWSNIKKVAGIAILSLFLLVGSASAGPPPALLEIDGNEQIAGIGDSCWKGEECADTFSIITPAEPLLTRSPFTAHLRLPLQESPEELGFSAIRVTDDDALRNEAVNDFRAWRYGLQGMNIQVPLERESDINLSLEPGLYVLKVFVKWEEKGDVSYGFLVQVNDPEAEVTNNVSSGGIPAEPDGINAPIDGEPVQTPDMPGFGAVVAVMGLLVWVGLAGRRR